jgi:hypothetical protein
MKKILLISLCLLVFMSSMSCAQKKQDVETKEPATKLETFLARRGELIIKDFYKLGVIPGQYGSRIKLDAIVIYEPGETASKVKGLRIEVTEGGQYGNSSTSFLDLEEVSELSKAISYMANLITEWQNIDKEYTEVIFSTKGEFKIGFYQEGTKASIFCSSGYIQTASCFFISADVLSSTKDLIEKGLKLLSEK